MQKKLARAFIWNGTFSRNGRDKNYVWGGICNKIKQRLCRGVKFQQGLLFGMDLLFGMGETAIMFCGKYPNINWDTFLGECFLLKG